MRDMSSCWGEIRERFDGRFFISHAIRRASPLGLAPGPAGAFTRSTAFYRRTIHYADQTVLMGYDTCLRSRKLYMAYLALQTRLLARLARDIEGHRVLIGIPSYEDVPLLCDPRVENIANAARAVRGALAGLDTQAHATVEGVAVYAEWVTDEAEWTHFRAGWTGGGENGGRGLGQRQHAAP